MVKQQRFEIHTIFTVKLQQPRNCSVADVTSTSANITWVVKSHGLDIRCRLRYNNEEGENEKVYGNVIYSCLLVCFKFKYFVVVSATSIGLEVRFCVIVLL